MIRLIFRRVKSILKLLVRFFDQIFKQSRSLHSLCGGEFPPTIESVTESKRIDLENGKRYGLLVFSEVFV